MIQARNRSKAKGIPFDLELSDVVIPTNCPVLGIKLEPGVERVGWSSPSLDRKYPEQGYVKGNVRVISYRANTLKNNASLEEMEKIVADLYTIQNQHKEGLES